MLAGEIASPTDYAHFFLKHYGVLVLMKKCAESVDWLQEKKPLSLFFEKFHKKECIFGETMFFFTFYIKEIEYPFKRNFTRLVRLSR